MIPEQFERTEMLLGTDGMETLQRSHVAVFGIGGVGGYVAEALVRSGIGAIDLIDNDTVCLSNLNRQIIATHSSIGRYKTEVMKERLFDINPHCNVRTHPCFYLPETKDSFDFSEYDYIADAIDTVTGKIQLVLQAQEAGTPIISCMGAGNKLNPTAFEVADIYKTSVCPLAKVMRRELKKRNVKHLKVVYSREQPLSPLPPTAASSSEASLSETSLSEDSLSETTSRRRSTPGSNAFVPSVAGLIMASEIIKDLVSRPH